MPGRPARPGPPGHAGDRPRRRIDRRDRRRRARRVGTTPGSRCSTAAPTPARRLAGQALGLPAAGRGACRRERRPLAAHDPPTAPTCSCSSTPTSSWRRTRCAGSPPSCATPGSTWSARTRARSPIPPAERLVQPLLQWSWLTTLPLGMAEDSPRPSLTAANGQLLAITPRRTSGPAATPPCATRCWRTSRWRGRSRPPAGGPRRRRHRPGHLPHVRQRSRSSSTGTRSRCGRRSAPRRAPPGATGLLTFAYVLPPAAALLAPSPGDPGPRGRRLRGRGGRAGPRRTAHRRPRGDAWSHPLAILALDGLTALSWWRHERGQLRLEGPPACTSPQGHRPLGHRGDRQRRVHADVRRYDAAVEHPQVLVHVAGPRAKTRWALSTTPSAGKRAITTPPRMCAVEPTPSTGSSRVP